MPIDKVNNTSTARVMTFAEVAEDARISLSTLRARFRAAPAPKLLSFHPVAGGRPQLP